MTISTTGRFATDRPERYLKQLASHLGRKLEVGTDGDATTILMGEATARLVAGAGSLDVGIESPADRDGYRLMGVVGGHLDKFGEREGLTFTWDDAALAQAARDAREEFLRRRREEEAAAAAE